MGWFKKASRRLKKKATRATRKVSRSVKKQVKAELRRQTRPVLRAAARVGRTKAARLVSRTASPTRLVPKSVRRAAASAVPASVRQSKLYRTGQRYQRKYQKSTLARLGRDPRLLTDPRFQRRMRKTAKTWGPTAMRAAATGVSFVPGYGTAAAAGLGTAAALAEGKSLTEAAREGALSAIPGGAAAQLAAETALAAAEGKRLDRAALQAAENTVAAKTGPAGRAAFRTAVAGARGENVARAAKRETLKAAMSYVPGGAAGNVAARALLAAARGENVAHAVKREATREAMRHVPGGEGGQIAARVARRVAAGQNPVDAAREETLAAALRRVPPGEATRIAAQTAAAIVRGEKPGSALSRGASEAASSAVGNVLARQPQESTMPRSVRTGAALLAPDPLRAQRLRPRGLAGHFGRVSERLARQAMAKNPTLATLGGYEMARRLGVSHAAAAKALRTGSALRWRPLSRRAAALVRSKARGFPARLTRGDTAGLSPDGLTYVIEDGDTGMKIAQKLVGDANRWRELLQTNPSKRSAKYGIAVYTGQTLVLPPSWVAEVAPEAPALTSAQILSSKATLKAWSLSDGVDQAGVTDYGARPEDLTTTWGPRDRLMLKSFAAWRGNLPSDGELTQQMADALATWAEQAANRILPAPTPIPSPLPTPTPPPRAMPPEVPALPLPSPAPTPPPAAVVPLPPVLPTLPGPIPTEPPALPPIPVTPVTPGLPEPPGAPLPTPVPVAKKSSAAPLAALGAGLAFLLL